MTTKRNREPHGAGRTRDKGQVKYYLAVCSLSGRKTAFTMENVERKTNSRENETQTIWRFVLKRILTEISFKTDDTRVRMYRPNKYIKLFHQMWNYYI